MRARNHNNENTDVYKRGWMILTFDWLQEQGTIKKSSYPLGFLLLTGDFTGGEKWEKIQNERNKQLKRDAENPAHPRLLKLLSQ
jgi:hypothetical protein